MLLAVFWAFAPFFAFLEQVHVAFTEVPGHLAISIVSDQDPATANAAPRLIFDGLPIDHDEVLPGYKRWFYHFLTQKLQSGSYEYHFEGHNSTVHQVIYPDEKKAEDGFSFLWFADMGVENSDKVIKLINDLLPENDFIIHGGDISYADDRDRFGSNTDTYNEIYDQWAAEMLNITSAKPYMVCPGNHEAGCHDWSDFLCDDRMRNFSYYNKRWRMPKTGVKNMWYSWDWAFVHFVSLSTETDFPGAPEGKDHWVVPRSGPFGNQLAWLEDDLKRNTKPWTVVYAHRPMRSSSTRDWPLHSTEKILAAFQPLFEKHGVDLFITGHWHAYERLYPMRGDNIVSQNYSNTNSLIQIISGAAGSIEGHEKPGKAEDFIAYSNNEDWGLNTFRWRNKTTLEVLFITENKEVKDSFVITKPSVY